METGTHHRIKSGGMLFGLCSAAYRSAQHAALVFKTACLKPRTYSQRGGELPPSQYHPKYENSVRQAAPREGQMLIGIPGQVLAEIMGQGFHVIRVPDMTRR